MEEQRREWTFYLQTRADKQDGQREKIIIINTAIINGKSDTRLLNVKYRWCDRLARLSIEGGERAKLARSHARAWLPRQDKTILII